MADNVATNFLSSVKAKGRKAMNWLKGIINRVRRGSKPPSDSRRELMTDRNTGVIRLPSIGRMYLFMYDPKWEKKLPWYDVYPLVIPFDYAKDTSNYYHRFPWKWKNHTFIQAFKFR